jgi:hypothetical protein
VSAKQTTELDAEIRAAFQAVEAMEPQGHLDGFEARLLARLEEDDMSEISNETMTSADEPVAAAGTAGEPSTGADDSELHDIRAMARSTKLRISQRMAAQVDAEETLLSASSLALRTISLPEPGKDAQALAPGEKSTRAATAHDDDTGLPAWIYAAISAVAAAAIVFFILRGHKPDEPIQVASNEPAATGQAENLAPTGHGLADPEAAPHGLDRATIAAGTADTAGTAHDEDGAAGAQAAEGSQPSAAGTSRVAAATRTGDAAAKSARPAGADDDEQKSGDGAAGAGTPDEASADPAKKPEKKSDALDDLLTEASGGAAGTGATGAAQEGRATASKPARTRLDSGDIKSAMTPIGSKAQACYDQSQLSGMVTVRIEFRVEPSGAITTATAKGEFAGTSTGECVAKAVKTATLPPYDGAPMTFTYPFLLTQ